MSDIDFDDIFKVQDFNTDKLLDEIDFSIDSIFPILDRLHRDCTKDEILECVYQLRGQLFSLRDEVVEANEMDNSFYQPMRDDRLSAFKHIYPDLSDNVIDKHFDSLEYKMKSTAHKSAIKDSK